MFAFAARALSTSQARVCAPGSLTAPVFLSTTLSMCPWKSVIARRSRVIDSPGARGASGAGAASAGVSAAAEEPSGAGSAPVPLCGASAETGADYGASSGAASCARAGVAAENMSALDARREMGTLRVMGLLFESLSSIASPGGVASHATRPRTLPGSVEKKRSRPRRLSSQKRRLQNGTGISKALFAPHRPQYH